LSCRERGLTEGGGDLGDQKEKRPLNLETFPDAESSSLVKKSVTRKKRVRIGIAPLGKGVKKRGKED